MRRAHSSYLGVLIQFAIVVGIMITQAMGLQLATPTQWRLVLIFSAVLGLIQLFMSTTMLESPHWSDRRGLLSDKDEVMGKIWRSTQIVRSVESELTVDALCCQRLIVLASVAPNYDIEEPLLDADEQTIVDEEIPIINANEHEATVSVPTLLTSPELRRPLAIVCFLMLCQQLSGMNIMYNKLLVLTLLGSRNQRRYVNIRINQASNLKSLPPPVLYYSNEILSKALPDMGPYVSLGITIVNFIMTAAPIYLIDVRSDPEKYLKR